MADTRYNVVIALHMPTGDVTKGAAEASRILDRLAADELSRSKKLSASQLREIQRGHRDQQREHSRAARQAASEYEKQLGSGFFSKLARAATRSFRDGFKIGGESFGGGGGLIGGALSVAGGSILTSVLGGVTSQITGAVKAGFDFNKLKEQSLLAFEIKLKGKKEAQDFFNQVAKFAEDTPLELDQALTSVQKLMVAFTAPEALRSMRAITDEVAKQGKVGGEAQESINGIGLQLQQILLKGKLQQEELVSLAERQINVYGFLTKKLASENADFARLGVEQQKEQLNEMVRRGEIDARAAVGAIVMGMEEEAGGTAARIARETAEGMESNIKDSLNRTAGVASESAFKEYKKFLDLTLDFLNTGAAERIAGNISATTGGLFAGLEKTLSAISSGNLGQLGLDAATSAAEGVQSGAKGLYNAGAGAAGEVERGWRDRLEQHSPSAVMQRLGFEAGASLLTGFIQGATQQGESVAEYYRRLAQDPRIRAWFEMLRQVEGGAPRTVVGGRQFPEGLREHPGSIGMGMMGPKGWSTAAGNWQITQTNWRRLAPTLGLNNFSDVDQQMIAALALFGEQGGIQSLLSGDLRGALRASQPWAGSPLSTLPGRKPLNAEQFIARYQQSLGGGDLTGGIGRFSTGPVDLEVSRLQDERRKVIVESDRKRQTLMKDHLYLENVLSEGMGEAGGKGRFIMGDERVAIQNMLAQTAPALQKLADEEIEALNRIDAQIEEMRARLAARAAADADNSRPDPFANISEEQARHVLRIATGGVSGLIPQERSPYLATSVTAEPLASVRLAAKEVGETFTNLPPLIKKTGKEAEKETAELARTLSGMFGGVLHSALRGQWRDGLRGLLDDFRGWTVNLFEEWAESKIFKALSGKGGSGSSAGGGATGSGLISSILGGVKSIFGFGGSSSLTASDGGITAPPSLTRTGPWVDPVAFTREFGAAPSLNGAGGASSFAGLGSLFSSSMPIMAAVAYGVSSWQGAFRGQLSSVQAATGAGVLGFFVNRLMRRRAEEKKRDTYSSELGQAVWAMIADLNAGRLDPSSAISQLAQKEQAYLQQANAIKDSKTKRHALLWFNNPPPTGDYQAAKQIFLRTVENAKATEARRERLIPAFADGGAVAGFTSRAFQNNPLGYVRGPGTSRSDSITAWFPAARQVARISASEYVLDAETTRNVGVDRLDALRASKGRALAEGGAVDVARGSSLESRLSGVTINVTNNFRDGIEQTVVEILDEQGERVVLEALNGRKVKRELHERTLDSVGSGMRFNDERLRKR